jgi:hypothetical protein
MTNEERLEELRATKFLLKELRESKGWEALLTFYRDVRLARRNAIFGSESNGMDGLIQMGQLKSELAGMDFIMSAPEMMFDEADLEEHGLLEEMQNADQPFDE